MDGQIGPISVIPQELLSQAKDFEKTPGFETLSPMGQANVLILQLAKRIAELELRVEKLENERARNDEGDNL
jgi:hypothetical protein